MPGLAQPAGEPRPDVRIDPVELQAVIGRRLATLADERLPLGERISVLDVDHHVVGDGNIRHDSPLRDPSTMGPYSRVSQEAVEALIRHPQAGLRYYQRVSVIDWGPAVMSNGRQVIPESDQGIAVSTFIYVAVEGRMFYLQFARTALPPVDSRYRASLPRDFWTLARVARQQYLRSLVTSPPRYRAAFRAARGERKVITAGANVGARMSIRETGEDESFRSHIRRLDVEKYTAIIERLLLDTVLDFLAGKNIDISDFKASADSIINVIGDNNQVNSNNKLSLTRNPG
jgi:hypothetical protein